jgi:uncharacterized DUF497 family protein
MKFEWDENKRIDNLLKHGLDFWYALTVFEDKNRVEYPDPRKDYGETRIRVIGKINRNILDMIIIMVVYTDRNGIIRIISARHANKRERRLYNGNS